MNQQEGNILERIHASYYHFTAAERKVADFVLARQGDVQFMSITQLADECGTAEATISRFCRSLQLKGFNAFKIELAKFSAAKEIHTQELSTDSFQGRCTQLGRLSIDAISQTVELCEESQVHKAVELLEKARRVLCIGAGGSMHMARECAHLFSTVCGKFTAIADVHSQLSAAATLEPGDVVIIFSYSGATNNGLRVLEFCKSYGIATILVTRFHKSPAAKLSNVVLRCGSNEGPFQFGSVPAKVAQLVVMDVLFQEYFNRNPEKCEETIERIAAALSAEHI